MLLMSLTVEGGINESGGIDVDCGKNIYVCGTFTQSPTFGETQLSTTAALTPYVAKLSPTFKWLWAIQADSLSDPNEARGLTLSVDSCGNSYISGYLTGSVTFGNNTLSSPGMNSAYIAKIDTGGNWMWAIQAEGMGAGMSQGVAIETAQNGIFLTGYFTSTVVFGSIQLTSLGNNDIFVVKVTSEGEWRWAIRGGGTGDDKGRGLCVDCTGNINVVGTFTGTADFGNFELMSTGMDDVFNVRIIDKECKNYPLGILSSSASQGEEVEVCFLDGTILERFSGLVPGYNYYLDDECEMSRCCSCGICGRFLGLSLKDTKMLTNFNNCNCN